MMDWSLAAKLKTAQTGGQFTHLSVYAELARLRSHEALLMGDFNTYAMNSTFVLTRVKKVSENAQRVFQHIWVR
jgi:hypothetical protein